jgi:hypothetical protein
MAQQTAVEWFYQRILAEDIKEVFEQAKAMEKQQIKSAHNHGEYFAKYRDSLDDENGLDYYNETYKK